MSETTRMTDERYVELRDMDREWDREEQGEMCSEAYRARASEAAKDKEIERLKADNAALLQALREHSARLQCSVCGGVGAHEAIEGVWFCEQGPTTLTQKVAALLDAARASEDAKDEEIAALKADNAALVRRVGDIRMCHPDDLKAELDAAAKEAAKAHPGAEVLEELTRLRAQVSTLIAGQQSNGEARQRAILDFACELAEMTPAQRDAAIRRIIDRSEDKP